MESNPSTAMQPLASSAWPPRLGRMYLYTVLMFLSLGAPPFVSILLSGGDARPGPLQQGGSTLVGFALLVLFGFLAHRDYKVARSALQEDPTLRGRWLTENAWWIGYVALVLPVLLWMAVGMAGVMDSLR